MEHRLRTGFAEGFEVGVQPHRAERCDHEELAERLECGGDGAGDETEAGKSRQGKEAQNEPRKDGLHVDVHGGICACRFLLFELQTDDSKDQNGGDNGKGPGELDHGCKVARRFTEGVAGCNNAGGVVDRSACPEPERGVGQPELSPENREDHNHHHVEQEGRR